MLTTIHELNLNMSKNPFPNKIVTRKDALKKISKYLALTALGTLIILNPQKAQAQSNPPDNDTSGYPF